MRRRKKTISIEIEIVTEVDDAIDRDPDRDHLPAEDPDRDEDQIGSPPRRDPDRDHLPVEDPDRDHPRRRCRSRSRCAIEEMIG